MNTIGNRHAQDRSLHLLRLLQASNPRPLHHLVTSSSQMLPYWTFFLILGAVVLVASPPGGASISLTGTIIFKIVNFIFVLAEYLLQTCHCRHSARILRSVAKLFTPEEERKNMIVAGAYRRCL
ncbi:hypothetical protein ASPWEDRAFT_458546 [Aspergillus wentii DTO 134E9]|uniref:Uncharacterized protein n=1 Tax=Aspergillus wentii DTO 134E9 TaxID=1073089 RepID=A0A1L9RRH8_ASPWE|nr:uncharacterized protein ASPWEDRAFT_458546 [Aspergillus wentii DTO 134E9]OJJ37541.1 hypothetical protein ASPWEDRAFT_458546 [Aspergillus wentii DTO 134E9]